MDVVLCAGRWETALVLPVDAGHVPATRAASESFAAAGNHDIVAGAPGDRSDHYARLAPVREGRRVHLPARSIALSTMSRRVGPSPGGVGYVDADALQQHFGGALGRFEQLHVPRHERLSLFWYMRYSDSTSSSPNARRNSKIGG
jgi:hypothetical protein